MLFRERGSKSGDARFGEYLVTRLVHAGEKSHVFQAQRLTSDHLVAIKVYTKSYDRTAAEIERKYGIPSEAEIGRQLNRPAGADPRQHYPIVTTIGEGREYAKRAGARFIVQEFADGVSLRRLIACRDPLLEERAGALVLQMCHALHIVHNNNCIFRDFCSENVIVSKAGELTLIDLGFVAPVGLAFEERTGTPSYMSPEQIRGESLGFETDVYSLGIVVHEMLTGQVPYASGAAGSDEDSARRRRLEVLRMHLEAPVPDLPDPIRKKSPTLCEAMTRCLQKKPQDRFHTMEELIAELV